MKVLHVGCGGSTLPDIFPELEEIRLDLDPASGANMIGSMLDIPLDDGRVDVVYTSHTLEHVTLHDGVRALKEFVRVLKPGGQCIVIVPNIGALAEHISTGNLYGKLYDSPGGPVCAADMLYGHQGLIERDGQHKAYRFQHKFGYTPETLAKTFESVGFRAVKSQKLNVWDVACTGLK
jgi:ubiquinone/menaquinone biosynthesis C-methylase UbiE